MSTRDELERRFGRLHPNASFNHELHDLDDVVITDHIPGWNPVTVPAPKRGPGRPPGKGIAPKGPPPKLSPPPRAGIRRPRSSTPGPPKTKAKRSAKQAYAIKAAIEDQNRVAEHRGFIRRISERRASANLRPKGAPIKPSGPPARTSFLQSLRAIEEGIRFPLLAGHTDISGPRSPNHDLPRGSQFSPERLFTFPQLSPENRGAHGNFTPSSTELASTQLASTQPALGSTQQESTQLQTPSSMNPEEVAVPDNNSMADTEAEVPDQVMGGTVGNGGSGGVNNDGGNACIARIPRHVHNRKFTIMCQKTVRYDFPGLSQNVSVFDSTTQGKATIWNGGPGTGVNWGWRYIPNQSSECYLTPQACADIYQLGGVQGTVKFLHAGVKVFNTRIATRMQSQANEIINMDKPYFKVYEDTDRILFGHTQANVGDTAFVAPCANYISTLTTGQTPPGPPNTRNIHIGVPNLTPLSAPLYWHTIETAVTDSTNNQHTLQSMLESTGGVELYQAGTELEFDWKLRGPAMALKAFNNETGNGQMSNVPIQGAANGNSILSTLLGAQLEDFPITRYLNYTTNTTSGQSERSEVHNSTPNMLLLTCPTLDNTTLGATDFVIDTELQTLVTYNLVVEVERQGVYHFGSSFSLTAATGLLNETDEANRVFRKAPKGAIFSSRSRLIGPYMV